MITLNSTRTVYFDCDDTLIIWEWKRFDPDGVHLIAITSKDNGVSEVVLPHHRHLTLMRQFKARGHSIVVWSQGGAHWAEAVVKALGIESLVDICMDKPTWFVDDLPAEAWMKKPIYLDPMNPLKDKRWGFEEDET